jgi:hypothetical protein
MMKRLLLVVVLVVVGIWAVPVANRARAQGLVPTPQGCDLLNDSTLDGVYPASGFGAPGSMIHFNAGETLVVTANPSPAAPVATQFILEGYAIVGGSMQNLTFHFKTSIPGTSTYHFADGADLNFVMWTADGLADWDVSCVKGGVGALGDCAAALTDTSVVGAFVQDALVYADPGVPSSPAITLPAGKTTWVLGIDASGQYYKIRWACQYLWVQVGTMGPNFDAVWNGHPLPTEVVD